MKLKTIKPPKVNVNGQSSFWKQLGMLVLGTSISLVFTLVAAKLVENHQRAKDRRLSAMMVMSNIEQFARLMDQYEEYMASADSAASWLLSKPIEELELMSEDELWTPIDKAFDILWVEYDKSAERIFSNNIDTWKNMGNVQFIDNVGQCFSAMNSTEEFWNKLAAEIYDAREEILDHPDDYEGTSNPIKILRNAKMRRYLKNVCYNRGFLTYSAAYMRYLNHKNMELIGITEQEVMEYTDARSLGFNIMSDTPQVDDFISSPVSPDSLTSSTFKALDACLDSLK